MHCTLMQDSAYGRVLENYLYSEKTRTCMEYDSEIVRKGLLDKKCANSKIKICLNCGSQNIISTKIGLFCTNCRKMKVKCENE